LYKEIKKQIKLTSGALNLDGAWWNQAVYIWFQTWSELADLKN